MLHVTQTTIGGVARYVDDLVVDQRRRGFRVRVASPRGGGPDRPEWPDGPDHVEWEARRSPGPSLAGEVVRLAAIVRAVDPDIVHLHSSKAGLAGRLAVRGRRATLFQPHAWSFLAVGGGTASAARRWERAATRWTHRIVCVSEAERAQGEELGLGALMTVVPNGVDLGRWTPAGPDEVRSARAALDLPEHDLVVVCAGRLTRQKGQDLAVRIWPAVRAQVPGARLVLVGDGTELESVRRQPPDGVRFVGHCDDLRPWFAAGDLVLQPSRWEGLSLVILEAMACGRSVVATDVPGATEALGRADALAPVDDADRLAALVVERLRDHDLRAAEGGANRSRVESHFDVGRTHDAVAAVYAGVVSSSR